MSRNFSDEEIQEMADVLIRWRDFSASDRVTLEATLTSRGTSLCHPDAIERRHLEILEQAAEMHREHRYDNEDRQREWREHTAEWRRHAESQTQALERIARAVEDIARSML